MSRDYYVAKAVCESYKSNCTHRHGAIIVDESTGKIISKGYNRMTNNQKHLLSIHAEMDALRKIKTFRNRYNNLSMYIVRYDSKELKYSKPCLTCACNIKRFGIKRIYFSFHDAYNDRVTGYNDKNIKISCQADLEKYFKKTSTFKDTTY